jgi:hypothetical protein
MKDDDRKYPELEKRINRYMDSEAENIDDELNAQFLEARQRALAAIPDKIEKQMWPVPVWLTSAMAGGLILTVTFLLMPSHNQPDDEFDTLITLLNSDDELEMMQHELEFYVWLETENPANNS